MSNAALLATASRLIAANGTDVTFTSIVTSGHDDTLGAPVQATVRQTVKAVLDTASAANVFGEGYQGDRTTAQKRLWIAGPSMSTPPRAGDTAEFDGSIWKVLSCEKINPDGTTYLYSVTVDR